MKLISQLTTFLITFNQWLLGTLMAVMVILVMANVVSRYGFNASISWAEELSRFLMVAITYLGMGLALRQGRLIAVDSIQNIFPRAAKLIRTGVAFSILLFMLGLSWVGYQYASFAIEQETPVLGISAMIPYMIIPLGTAIMILHLVLFFKSFVDKQWDAEDSDLTEGGQ